MLTTQSQGYMGNSSSINIMWAVACQQLFEEAELRIPWSCNYTCSWALPTETSAGKMKYERIHVRLCKTRHHPAIYDYILQMLEDVACTWSNYIRDFFKNGIHNFSLLMCKSCTHHNTDWFLHPVPFIQLRVLSTILQALKPNVSIPPSRFISEPALLPLCPLHIEQ